MLIYNVDTLAFMRVNSAAAELYGYSRAELERMNAADVLVPEEVVRLREILKVTEPALRRSSEWRNRLKDGSIIIVEVNSHALEFEEQQAMLVMVQNIAERKRSEETLLKLKKAVETSSEAIFLTDTEGVFTYINPGFTALYSYSADEVIGKSTPRIIKSGLLDAQVYVEFWKRLSGGHEVRGELINKKKNGKLVDVEGSATPIFDDAGRIIGYLGIQHDITPRKQAEDALRVAEENFRSIFENATVGIYQSTPQGRFVSLNPAMARIFGYDSPQDMMDSIAEIETQYYVDPADRREFQRRIFEHGEVFEFCSWGCRRDGTRIWIQENARAVKDSHGNVQYYEGFVTDITEQKHTEDGLYRAKESLEHANRELENVLAREQHLARTDGLTGLYNYRYFFEVASHEFNIAMRYRHPISVLMFDADGFKQINDTYGHFTGDTILAKMAETVTAQMRTSDVLARYGGDEFVILLSHTNAQQAFSIAERIRMSVESLPLRAEQVTLPLTLSIGVAELCYEPRDSDIERIIQRADKALYAAKQAGRNRTVIFE
jgi:diguanylate cyclase (GGDEF)-like protein/PAS domain S-box-containing protein